MIADAVADRVVERLSSLLGEAKVASAAPQPLLTKSELAGTLNVSPATIDRMVRDGRIPFVRVGDARRFDLARVRAALEARADAPLSEVTRSPAAAGPTTGIRLLSKGA